MSSSLGYLPDNKNPYMEHVAGDNHSALHRVPSSGTIGLSGNDEYSHYRDDSYDPTNVGVPRAQSNMQ